MAKISKYYVYTDYGDDIAVREAYIIPGHCFEEAINIMLDGD